MAIPLTYVARNLWARRLTTALTARLSAGRIRLRHRVIIDAGLKNPGDNGRIRQRIAIRRVRPKSKQDRSQPSQHHRDAPGCGATPGGHLASKETVVLISLTKTQLGKSVNVIIRGITARVATASASKAHGGAHVEARVIKLWSAVASPRALPARKSASTCVSPNAIG
jgi:putative ABC transport system permease protein